MSLLKFNEAYKPFKYAWAMNYAVTHEANHWIEAEVKLNEDVDQWKSGALTPAEKSNITQILRIFTQSDISVAQVYCDVFIPKFKNNEIRCMLISFAAREGIHIRAYSLLNDTLGLDDDEYTAFLKYKEMADKIEFMMTFDASTVSGLGLTLAKTVCNEGVLLFGSFVALLNYQRFGKMKGAGTITQFSIREESQHAEAMSKLFREYCKEHPKIVNDEFKSNIYKMFTHAYELESAAIDLTFASGEQEGLSISDLKLYIQYLVDRRLVDLGLKPIYNVKENPLEWVDWIVSNNEHTNFFEAAAMTSYSQDNLSGDWGW